MTSVDDDDEDDGDVDLDDNEDLNSHRRDGAKEEENDKTRRGEALLFAQVDTKEIATDLLTAADSMVTRRSVKTMGNVDLCSWRIILG